MFVWNKREGRIESKYYLWRIEISVFILTQLNAGIRSEKFVIMNAYDICVKNLINIILENLGISNFLITIWW